ncbi:MAG: VIT and vWA domain-containing protein [Cellvibrionaceae bacterium]
MMKSLHNLSKRILNSLAAIIGMMATLSSQAAGLLTPTDSQLGQLDIREHHVNVVINNGYVTTSVDQTFFNPNTQDVEAIYSFPVPEKAAVGEFTYWIDGKPIVGEVVEKEKARTIYEQEKQAGREAAIVEKDEYRTFDIAVSPVRANSDVRIRLVYIQAAHIDTSVGRYVYPLEDGGVDEVKNAFWSRNEVVSEKFSFNLHLHSGFPVDALRLPQHNSATINKINNKEWTVNLANVAGSLNAKGEEEITTEKNTQTVAARLDKDILVYWRLADNLPGAMELVTYNEENKSKGTFMLTLTPGDDLNNLQQGKDWVFVLDISGSMNGKYSSLVEGVRQGLAKLRANDRFKVVLFNNNATDFTQGFLPVTQANVEPVLTRLQNHQPGGGTNLYAGLNQGVSGLDADRSSAIILVTDGVANVGTTEKKAFTKLLKKHDVRLFTFVMGNSANRPLLDEMTAVSNGFAQSISNADDITGQILLAAQKMTHESLRNITIDIKGVRTSDLTPKKISSLYRGEQLVVLGHYVNNGSEIQNATITIKGKSGDREQVYKSNMNFANDQKHPELERLWAFGMIEHLQNQLDYYLDDNTDTKQAITDIAKQYSLVTDYTSMIVVREEVLQQLGIDPNNKQRVEKEQQARATREQNPTASQTNQQPISNKPRPSLTGSGNGGGGGGSLSIWFLLIMSSLLFFRRIQKA